MGRPKLQASEKRQQINFRLTPEDRRRLEAMAEKDGVSLPVIAERLVLGSMSLLRHPLMDDNLAEIFAEILDEMQEVQRRNNDLPWYRDLTTWAGCKMIFAKGPFARRNPDDWLDKPEITAIWERVLAARKSKQEAVNLLSGLEVTVGVEKIHNPLGSRGLFGGSVRNALLSPIDVRNSERRSIEAIEDEATRAQALAIFSIVEKLDVDEAEAMDKWHKEIRNYTDAENEGVELYKSWRREVVQQQMARRERPSMEDIY